jgi:hypothetical protein
MNSTTVLQVEAPAAIRALSPITEPDYLDQFTLTAAGVSDSSAEQWARSAFEDVAGRTGQVVWRGIVGLRLSRRPAPDRLAGWRIAERGDGWLRLEARGWMLTAHVVFHVEGDRLSIATFIRYDRPPAAVLWPPMAERHRRAVPRVLVAAYRARRGAGREARPAVQLPITAHTAQPWRIHDLTREFRIEDVWALPSPGGPDDLARLVGRFAAGIGHVSGPTRVLFAVRRTLGTLLGWDRPDAGVGARVRSLRDRLPADLRERRGPDLPRLPFRPLYLTDTEWAAETANQTVHAVVHIGWIQESKGRYRGQMAILVKPNGTAGRAYMAAIAPFRYRIVYPALIRSIGRGWRPAG